MPRRTPTFDLQIDFTGLCLFVEHTASEYVTVIMPNAKMPPDGIPPRHDDGMNAVPHAGYLRSDLANVSPTGKSISSTPLDALPTHEIVHLLDYEEVDLQLPSAPLTADRTELLLPDFGEVADLMVLHPQVLDAIPPRRLVLSRLVLQGGAFERPPGGRKERWKFAGDLKRDRKETPCKLSGRNRWRRLNIPGTQLNLRTRTFGQTEWTDLPLFPTTTPGGRPLIALKYANLCATNPLEWAAFGRETMLLPPGSEDDDFKWLYRLMTPGPDANYPAVPLPHPLPDQRGELQDCFGAIVTSAD